MYIYLCSDFFLIIHNYEILSTVLSTIETQLLSFLSQNPAAQLAADYFLTSLSYLQPLERRKSVRNFSCGNNANGKEKRVRTLSISLKDTTSIKILLFGV